MGRLEGKRAVITGAAGGIGEVVAQRFADEGARLVLVDVDQAKVNELAARLGSDIAHAVAADVSNEEAVRGYVETAVRTLGGIDVFLNNAGIEGHVAPTPDYPTDMFDQVMAVNVRGAFLGMKYVMPHMKANGGSIVITSSVAGQMGTPGISAYTTSKHAVVGLMRTTAIEGAADRIRVNTVHPGPVHTRMIRALETQIMPDDPDEARRLREARVPMQRYGEPQEVANIMLFLASDESAYCTGGTYMVDGGQSAL